MKVNMGSLDRGLRIVVGAVLIAAVFFIEGPMRWWGLVGIVPFLTGVLGSCPVYSIFGISTCPAATKPS